VSRRLGAHVGAVRPSFASLSAPFGSARLGLGLGGVEHGVWFERQEHGQEAVFVTRRVRRRVSMYTISRAVSRHTPGTEAGIYIYIAIWLSRVHLKLNLDDIDNIEKIIIYLLHS
jgi:hypothetical protein